MFLGPEFRVKIFNYCYVGNLKQQGGIHAIFPCCFFKGQLLNHFVTSCIKNKIMTIKRRWGFEFILKIKKGLNFGNGKTLNQNVKEYS